MRKIGFDDPENSILSIAFLGSITADIRSLLGLTDISWRLLPILPMMHF